MVNGDAVHRGVRQQMLVDKLVVGSASISTSVIELGIEWESRDRTYLHVFPVKGQLHDEPRCPHSHREHFPPQRVVRLPPLCNNYRPITDLTF